MKINKLVLNNFRSFYGTHEIDFSNLHGIYKVTGNIGSGKSSISLGILFGLFGDLSNLKLSDLVSWGSSGGYVELFLESSQKYIHIKRDVHVDKSRNGSSKLHVDVNNKPIESSNKRGVQEILEEYLDMSRLSMELLCIISFNNFKSLSWMSRSEITDFQDSVLGFSVLNTYKDTSNELSNECYTDYVGLCASLDMVQRRLDNLKNRPSKISGSLIEIREQLDKLSKEFNNTKKKLQDSLQELERNHRANLEKRSIILSNGKKLNKDIEFIKKGVCPTCGSQIDQSKLPNLEKSRETLLDEYKDAESECSESQKNLDRARTKFDYESKNYQNEKTRLEKIIAQLELQESYKNDDLKEIDSLEIDEKDLSNKIINKRNEQEQYKELSKLFSKKMRSILTKSYIGPINKRCKDICVNSGMSFVPVFDEDFKCCVEKIDSGGLERIPLPSLSTGQAKLVDMVCILGIVSSIISSTRCNIIFLDELFSNLDTVSRNTLLRILPSVFPKESLILVVSHQSLDDSLLSGSFKLSIEDGRSNIEIESF